MQLNTDRKTSNDLAEHLLTLLQIPADRSGISDALPNLIKSAKTITRYLSDPNLLAELISSLESLQKDLIGHKDFASRDRNSMQGRYSQYPLYSLFTQIPAFERNDDIPSPYYVLTGLLLTDIWLHQDLWENIPQGFVTYLTNLRVLRKNDRSDRLPAINLAAQSLDELFYDQPNEFLAKSLELSRRIQARLSIASPETPLKTSSPTKDVDLGDTDTWKVGKSKVSRPTVTARAPAERPQNVILEPPSQLELGQDNAERGIIARLTRAPSTPNTEELPGLVDQIAVGLESRYASDFDNQLLPDAWENLNEYEINTLVDLIKQCLADPAKSRDQKIGALLALISIITCRDAEDLAAIGFVSSGEARPTTSPTIFLDGGCWFSPFPRFDRFKPTPSQAEWLQQVGDGCFLPIPIELADTLKFLAGPGNTLGEALSLNHDAIYKLLSGFCSAIRQDARTRVNVSWMRSIIFTRLLNITQDDVGCAATLGKTEFSPSTGLFYATFLPAEWQVNYNRALQSLSLTPTAAALPTAPAYGSRQYPDEHKLKSWIQGFAKETVDQIKGVRQVPQIVAAHNHFACYTFLMLLANTGHRPAVQYSFSRNSIDLENGWVIISDKVTSATTRVRPIPLANVAIKQLTSYLSHLKNLAGRISNIDSELAAKIRLIVDSSGRQLLPLFFLLDDKLNVTPVGTDSFPSWPYEMNGSRHFLATGLRRENVIAEYIASLLAHIENGQFSFSKFSCLCPTAWQASITPALNRHMDSMQWKHIDGLSHSRKSAPDREVPIKRLANEPEIDPFAKARRHVDESIEDRKAVKRAFKLARKNTPKNAPAEMFIEAFENEIKAQSLDAPDRLGIRLNYHVRFVRMHRHALRATSIPGWATDMHTEDTPFEPETLWLADCAHTCRLKLIQAGRSVDSEDIHEHVALVLLSSILFGALLRKPLVDSLPDLLFTGLRCYEDVFWIEFDDSQSGGCQRWLPDPATLLLIGRLLSMKGTAKFNRSKLRSATNRIIRQLDLQIPTLSSNDTITNLIKIAGAYFTLHLPGILRALALGDIRAASLPERTLLRLLSGKPLGQVELPEQKERGMMYGYPKPSTDVLAGRAILKNTLKATKDELPPSNSGATSYKGKRKDRLSKLAKSLEAIKTANPGMPSVSFALLSWAVHLATEGSVIEKKPSVGTIYSYLTTFSRILVNLASEVDFLELGEGELADIYQRVIEFGETKTRTRRAKTLRRFHEFCEDEFDLTEVDWDEVAPGLTYDQAQVSANLVTHQEYLIAKELIRKHPRLTKRERQMYELALILLYRCGLRLGELLRLTVSDVVILDKSVLLVRNGIYGKTKSRAGVRQVPWLDRLDSNEMKLLEDWLEHRMTVTKADPWGALFGSAAESRILEMRAQFSKILTEVLRHASGDMSVRIHHLRHGAGTNGLTLSLTTSGNDAMTQNASNWFSAESQTPWEEFREFHLGNAAQTRRIVYAISMALGHSSPRTSIWHYGHSLDFMLGQYAASLTALRNVDIAALSGMGQNLLNVSSFKNPKVPPVTLAIRWLFKDIDGLQPVTKLADKPVNTDKYPDQAPIHPITSLSLAHTILAEIGQGFDGWKIASRHTRELEEINSLEQAAIKLERKTGYRKYDLANKNHQSNDVPFIKAHKAERLLSGHFKEVTPRMEAALVNPKLASVMEDGLEAWQENYLKSQSGLRLDYKDDLDKFIVLLETFGIDESKIRVSNERSGTTEHQVVNVYREAAPKVDRPKQYNAASSMHKLHHACFLGCALVQYRKKIGQPQNQ